MSEKVIDNKQKKQNKTLTIFLATFIITFAFVAMAVKYFSPEIDVEIGKVTEEEQVEDEDKGSVDERLRWIQFEDNMPGVSTRFTDKKDENKETEIEKATEEDNVIKYDEDLNKKQPKAIEKEPVVKVEKVTPQVPEVKPVKPTNPPVTSISTSSKVYVGQYSTIEQAIAMQNRLAESGLNLAPFVKRVGSNYVVQVGSYSSPQKAQSIATEIQNAGYAARVVGE